MQNNLPVVPLTSKIHALYGSRFLYITIEFKKQFEVVVGLEEGIWLLPPRERSVFTFTACTKSQSVAMLQ
jgi:hypothetical protein